MADFDGSGFAAVDAFFGGGPNEDVPSKLIPEKLPQTGGGSKKRLGVGAAAVVATTATRSFEGLSSKRILRVGSKRRRKQGFGDEEDDEIDEDQPKRDDDEDEEGRTAIDKGTSESKKAVVAKEAALEKLEKNKKLGKKERQQLVDTEHQEKKGTASPDVQDDNGKEVGDDKKKRKRRKVRSRQKNIRKDHRDVKPAHLVPGQGHYLGRPLTEETRARLNLPTIGKSPFAAEAWTASGNWNDDNEIHAKSYSNALDAMPLAIDSNSQQVEESYPTNIDDGDGDGDGDGDDVANTPMASRDTKGGKPKKSRQRKYKNL